MLLAAFVSFHPLHAPQGYGGRVVSFCYFEPKQSPSVIFVFSVAVLRRLPGCGITAKQFTEGNEGNEEFEPGFGIKAHPWHPCHPWSVCPRFGNQVKALGYLC